MRKNEMHSGHVDALFGTTVKNTDMLAPLAAQSWKRCVEVHHLDPEVFKLPPTLGHRELNLAREEHEDSLLIAKEELDSLFLAVKSIGYSTSLANKNGIILIDSADHNSENWYEFDRPGTLWTEEHGGTNGVGTCLATGEFTTIFQDEHFFSDLAPTACVAAPLYGPICDFWGVMNLSIKREMLQEETHKLAGAITRQYARRLSARLFKNAFRDASIFQFRDESGEIGLLALGQDQVVLGANILARKFLNIAEREINVATMWKFIDKNTNVFKAGSGTKDVSFRIKDRSTTLVGNLSLVGKAAAPRARAVQRSAPSAFVTLDEWAGEDPSLMRSAQLARRILSAELPVLVLGETGTGKDTFARGLHKQSARADGPFVAFNCAAVPETLIDSELFGYASGAFTGANREGNAGRVVEAHGGTLFLDEIGDMPLSLQTRLLRLLETREVVPLGSGKAQPVDIQVIAATNQNLEQAIAKKQFREDLYYRLAGAVIDIPPLRERKDMGLVIDRLLERVTPSAIELVPEARRALLNHKWPGNIRELVNVLRRAVAVCVDGRITIEDLMIRSLPVSATSIPALRSERCSDPLGEGSGERQALIAALLKFPKDLEAAAAFVGMSRATIYRKIGKHNIDYKNLSS